MASLRTLEQLLADRSAPGLLYTKGPEGRARCHACAHRCLLAPGKRGICQVRFNEGGTLRVPQGYVGGLQVDPIEKKPFFHALPGTRALSFGMLGCDFHCDYCQNWVNSQALRDPASEAAGAAPRDITPAALAQLALEQGCPTVTSTYNEPLITAEWAVEVFQAARARGLLTSFVSNGHATPEALEYLRPWVDLYKVDLKCFNERTYRKMLGGSLKAVLETLERLPALGFWLEVVTLVIPGVNDGEEELKAVAKFLASVSRDIPWHVTAFHPDYKMGRTPATGAGTLNLSWEIGKAAGLRYVYSGNRPGEVGDTENTRCPGCGGLLIERRGFRLLQNRLAPGGKCPDCAAVIPGVWTRPAPELVPRESA